MCYTGTCPYEDFVGECTLSITKSFPDDAWCMDSKRIEQEEKEYEKICAELEEHSDMEW